MRRVAKGGSSAPVSRLILKADCTGVLVETIAYAASSFGAPKTEGGGRLCRRLEEKASFPGTPVQNFVLQNSNNLSQQSAGGRLASAARYDRLNAGITSFANRPNCSLNWRQASESLQGRRPWWSECDGAACAMGI